MVYFTLNLVEYGVILYYGYEAYIFIAREVCKLGDGIGYQGWSFKGIGIGCEITHFALNSNIVDCNYRLDFQEVNFSNGETIRK